MSCLYGNAQYIFEGRITNESNLPLKDVHIHLGNKITTTNADGIFSLKNIAEGNYKLYISYIGYETITETKAVFQNTVYDKQLIPSILNLETVTVKTKVVGYSEITNEQKITQKVIEDYSNQSLGDVLKEISGVSVLKTGSTVVKPVVNGLHSFRVPIITNNVRLEDQQWGMEHAPNFDINSAQSITVLKGTSALQFGGDAIGGIVIVEPIEIKKDTLFGRTILNGASNGRGGSLTSSVTKRAIRGWSWGLLGTVKYLGDRETPNYVLSNTGNREQNFSGNMMLTKDNYSLEAFYSFYNAQIGILRASHIGNATDLFNAIKNQTPSFVTDFSYDINNPRQEVTHHLAKFSYHQNIGSASKLELQYAFQNNNRKEFDVRRNSNDKRAALDLDLISHALVANYKTFLNKWKLTNGVNFNYQNNLANPETGVRPLIPNFNKLDFGLFSIGNYKVSNSLKLEMGVRYDFTQIEADKFYLKSRWNERNYNTDFSDIIVTDFGTQWLTNPSFTYHNFSGSIGFNKQFHHEIEWLLSAGFAARNPNVSELFSDGLHHAIGQIELGDLRLRQEKAFKINSTFRKEWKAVSLEINPFLNRIQDFIYLQPTGFETTIRGAFPVWEYKQTNALLTGADLNVAWNINENFNYKGTASYLLGTDLSTSDYIIDMPPLNTNHSLSYQDKKLPLTISLQSETVFQQNNYPNFNFETNIIANGNLTPALVDISTPPKAYSLLHFRSSYEFSILKNKKLVTAFSVQNIFNTSYRDYLNRQRFYADELGRNIQIQLKLNY